MSELDYDALQRLADAATPGPWSASVVCVAKDADGQRRGAGVLRGASGGYVFMSANGPEILVADAEFIAAARSAVPALLDRVRELEAALANARTHRSLPYGCVWNDYYSPDEVIRIREPIEAERDAALATIAKMRQIHTPVEIEPSDTICGECSYQLPNGHYFGKVEEYPCPTIRALGSVPSTGEGNE